MTPGIFQAMPANDLVNQFVAEPDAPTGQEGHACMAIAETSRSSFSVALLAA